MIWVTIFLLFYSNLMTYLFIRSVKRLFQFDNMWTSVTDTLQEYQGDLGKMLSGEILVDHPEVAAFHRRNTRALQDITGLVDGSRELGPQTKKEPLPRPEVV